MLGIIVLFPRMRDWYPPGKGPVKRIWTAAALSISCQLFTAPAAWLHFHTFPKYFLMSNLIALPLAEAVIVTALAALLLTALGICPPALVKTCGSLVQLLEFSLETVASM